VLFNVTGGDNLSLFEVNQAAEIIKQAVDQNANIIFGVVRDSLMDKDIKITLIATGFQTSSLSGSPISEAEISGYMKDLKGDNEEQLDVPAFPSTSAVCPAARACPSFHPCAAETSPKSPVL